MLREPHQCSDLVRRHDQAADQAPDPHPSCEARRDDRPRQPVRRGIDDDAHRDDRKMVLDSDFRHGRAFHVDRCGAGNAKCRGFIRGRFDWLGTAEQIALSHGAQTTHGGDHLFSPCSGGAVSGALG
jgi:hypothetical protein